MLDRLRPRGPVQVDVAGQQSALGEAFGGGARLAAATERVRRPPAFGRRVVGDDLGVVEFVAAAAVAGGAPKAVAGEA